jgi:predicted ribosomally synthesized peptide with nif11-like leader
MIEEQLSALLAKLKDDAGLQEKFKGATDLDAAMEIAKQAGYEVDKEDWLNAKSQQSAEVSDEELAGVAGGSSFTGKDLLRENIDVWVGKDGTPMRWDPRGEVS